jgi:lysophospholipase L1-like esterase
MQRMPPAKRGPGTRLLLALLATILGLGLAEVLVRLFVSAEPQQPLGQLSFQRGDGTPITREEAVEQHLVVALEPSKTPRPRFMFAPGQRFFLCYSDAKALARDWLDADGRAPVRINRFGLRERDEITPEKPPGQKRIVCLGDSFTFGWGIPEEMGWVRLLEDRLRADGKDVRTVNCGAAGTVCVDEYWWGLQHRFHVFGPDAVIVTLCLNDLIPSSGVSLIGPAKSTGLRLLDLVHGALGRSPLDLDPAHDWVDELLRLPEAEGTAAGLYHPTEKPFEAMWSQGVPQKSLRAMKAWCDERGIPLLVVLWPFLQGLGEGRHYPFQKLHDLVAADCRAAGIPFLDVLPALAATPAEQLWVTPADPHANPLAHRLVLPALHAFVAAHLQL